MNDNPASAIKQRIFRADHVGSFLRPATLVDARKKREAGAISSAELCAIEDQAIRDLVRRQEDIGLRVVTDGDYRRGAFHIDFLTRLRGIEWNPRPFAGSFKEGGSAGLSPAVFECKAKVEHVRDVTVADYEFLARSTKETAKVTLPAPSFAHARGGRAAISREIYPDIADFFHDLAAAYNAEVRALVDQVAHPRVRMMVDVKSMSAETLSIADNIRACRGRFDHVHANDANLKGPGFGDTDYRPIAAALREVEFNGYVSVEVFDYTEGAEVIAARSLDYLRRTFSTGQ